MNQSFSFLAKEFHVATMEKDAKARFIALLNGKSPILPSDQHRPAALLNNHFTGIGTEECFHLLIPRLWFQILQACLPAGAEIQVDQLTVQGVTILKPDCMTGRYRTIGSFPIEPM